ncbi:MAG: tRNA uridine-5-carboxymethylaminomethyl(34) synthesis GTPase MnmE [Bacteroidia bacterium]|nr:tRNA uridine-5-carboxymethylaminomethyl(34) synthesis GTPase MnmE [Bacteroidia bacterium]
MNNDSIYTDTICAISTSAGTGAIAIIRLSGKDAVAICEKLFNPTVSDKKLSEQNGFTIHHGIIADNNDIIDDVLVHIFRTPHSYTGEGSLYIQERLIQLLITNGARSAQPGEFTLRAFLNKKIDLTQAEAIADLIASNSEAMHKVAIQQMRSGFSKDLKKLREQLLDFVCLIELELDFSEEDVEFADRRELLTLLSNIQREIDVLAQSFKLGNVLKKGIPVAIIGKPNVGKSTLLNVLLNEEKAIVSEIPGTTRDAIEDTIVINGINFRFIDTAGLRKPVEVIENMGIEKTYEKINQATVILYIVDISETPFDIIISDLDDFRAHINDASKRIIVVVNKIDKFITIPEHFRELVDLETIFISAKRRQGIGLLTDSLLKSADFSMIAENTVVANIRHYEALIRSKRALDRVSAGLETNLPTDLITQDIREALHFLGEITGEIVTDEILGNIFSKFCIGK